VTNIGHMALGKANQTCLTLHMDLSDGNYQSFIIRIWREDEDQCLRKTGLPIIADDETGDGWLFQLENRGRYPFRNQWGQDLTINEGWKSAFLSGLKGNSRLQDPEFM